MAFLKSCKIENYRGLREARIEFDALSVLIGENDSGRSSLLNALETCLGRHAPPGTCVFSPRDVHRPLADGDSRPIRITLGFSEDARPPAAATWMALRSAGLAHENGRLDFSMTVEASPEIRIQFHGPRPLVGDPHDVLEIVRQAIPFLRLRSAVLKPAPLTAGIPQADDAARLQVDWELRRAFEEVLESPGEVAERTMAAARSNLSDALERLLPRIQDEPPPEDRVHTPSPISSTWARVASLLGGTGARSIAMLAFAEALLDSRGTQLLHPDAHPVVSFEDPEAYLHPVVLASVWGLIHRMPAQKIITTNSSELLAATPIGALRRMVRDVHGRATVYSLPDGSLDDDELRRVAYHLRVLRGNTLFMRFWLMVEGETEFWLLPEAARAMDIDLVSEGIGCIEFAQCGIAPLAKMANHLGIGWHLLCDGDRAGDHYAAQAGAGRGLGRVTQLRERDIEHSLWAHGYAHIYRHAAGVGDGRGSANAPSHAIIDRAIRRTSKPRLALTLGEAMVARGAGGVPPPLRDLLEDAVHRARYGARAYARGRGNGPES